MQPYLSHRIVSVPDEASFPGNLTFIKGPFDTGATYHSCTKHRIGQSKTSRDARRRAEPLQVWTRPY